MNALSNPKRMFYLDNIRIYLTILVILHHATLAYGGNGGWAIKDTITDEISPILFTIFNALNQSYFMTAFFLLAGYFTPGSLAKKAKSSFLMDRVIRLGVPLVIYTILITNLNEFMIATFYTKTPFQVGLWYDPGHLWFLQLLFLFAVAYVVYKGFTKEELPQFDNPFPSNNKIWIGVAVLSLLTFIVRLAYPVGITILNVQPAHSIHYLAAFFVGTLAYRANWFEKLPSLIGKKWGWYALISFPFLIVFMVLGGALESEANVAKFLGGLSWQSLAYSVWETVMMIAIIIFLIYFFREHIKGSGNLKTWMAVNVYTVYIIHQTILYGLNLIFLFAPILSYQKFIAVSLIGVPFSFLLSSVIRKIPYSNRVLG